MYFPLSQTTESAKQKAKKKKAKKAGAGGEKTWNNLFTLPEREGMVGEESATNDK